MYIFLTPHLPKAIKNGLRKLKNKALYNIKTENNPAAVIIYSFKRAGREKKKERSNFLLLSAAVAVG